jgi:hypothetical protein
MEPNVKVANFERITYVYLPNNLAKKDDNVRKVLKALITANVPAPHKHVDKIECWFRLDQLGRKSAKSEDGMVKWCVKGEWFSEPELPMAETTPDQARAAIKLVPKLKPDIYAELRSVLVTLSASVDKYVFASLID